MDAASRYQLAPRRSWLAVAALAASLVSAVVTSRPAAADATLDQRMLELLNRERTAAGLAPVASSPVLAAAAGDAPYLGCGFPVAGRATDMGVRNYFSHTILGCGTQSIFNLLGAASVLFSGAGENIAWVNAAADPLVAADNLHAQLMASAGHRANILSPSFTNVGIASWHTAPGQTWSGAGFPLPNVYIVTEVFAGPPLGLGLGAPPTTSVAAAPTTVPNARFSPLSPSRILDTRSGVGRLGPLGSGASMDLRVTGVGRIPAAGVAAVALTVAVTQPTVTGFLALYPSGIPPPPTANLNFSAGETVSNLVVVKVGANGAVGIYNGSGTVHVIADVAGWYSQPGSGNAGRLQLVTPARILDSRSGIGGGTRIGAGMTEDVQVTGRGGVPASGAQAAVVNLTVSGGTAPSYLTAYPAGEPRPLAANLTFSGPAPVTNRAIVKLGAGGKVTVFNGAGSTDLTVDVGGWFTDASVAGAAGGFVPLIPSRVLDTRTGTGGIIGLIGAGATPSVQLSGRGGIPASGAKAVVLNATVTGPAAAGTLTLYPTGTANPGTPDIVFAAGDNQPNLIVAPLSADGWVTVTASATTHVIFDVAGWIT